jgi:preprotein translocase subunit SecY
MNWKNIFKSLKNKDMRRRVFTVLGIIAIYRFLAHVPVPLAGPADFHELVKSAINSTDLGGFLNLLTGGGLTSFSIVMVGISPYITASIISQLLSKIIPSLEELSKDGETGQRKINQWTRMLAVPLAIIQSVAYIAILRQTVLAGASTTLTPMTAQQWVIAVLSMTVGSILLMWLGELATEQGIGNGTSTIIFIGIVAQMPAAIGSITASLFDTSAGALNVFGWFTLPVNPVALSILLILLSLIIVIIYLLVKINEAQRLININYAKRVHGNSSYGGIRSLLPIKLIAAGVIPVIFAVAFLSIPSFIAQLLRTFGGEKWSGLATNLTNWFQTPTAQTLTSGDWQAWIYPVLYILLIVKFTYFYTSIVFNAKEISENLQKQGGFVAGVRPGIKTEKYLAGIVSRLTLFGSFSLGLIAITPFVIEVLLYLLFGVSNMNMAIGGTGALIVVTVALENLRQISSRALMITYDDYDFDENEFESKKSDKKSQK